MGVAGSPAGPLESMPESSILSTSTTHPQMKIGGNPFFIRELIINVRIKSTLSSKNRTLDNFKYNKASMNNYLCKDKKRAGGVLQHTSCPIRSTPKKCRRGQAILGNPRRYRGGVAASEYDRMKTVLRMPGVVKYSPSIRSTRCVIRTVSPGTTSSGPGEGSKMELNCGQSTTGSKLGGYRSTKPIVS